MLKRHPRVAILWHGDRETRQNATAENNKFRQVFEAFAHDNFLAEPAVYHDAFADEVRRQLREVDGVLVWVNPLQDDMNRTILDDLLREVASRGVFVSTHPDTILKMGTKEVLFQTRVMGWGGDIHLYKRREDFRQHFPARLANGSSRVLKQNRGNNGIGVWRVE
ncbi:MAG TPA: Cj0069 family protein, partial [Ktedonobacteraceae bacterium]